MCHAHRAERHRRHCCSSTGPFSDVREIISADLIDGTEVYSSFISEDMAAILLTPRQSPLKAWEEANPGKDANQATIREILETYDKTQRAEKRPSEDP